MFFLYIKLKYKNIKRILWNLGTFRVIFLAFISIAFVTILLTHPNHYLIPFIYFVSTYGYHSYRNDLNFLKSIYIKISYLLIREYLLLSIPFILIHIIREDWAELTIYPLITLSIYFLPAFRLKTNFLFSIPFLKKGGYEFNRGLRKNFLLYLLFIFLFFQGSYYHNISLSMFAGIICMLTFAGFYILPIKTYNLLNYKNVYMFFRHKISVIVFNLLLLYIPYIFIACFSNERMELFNFLLKLYISSNLFITGVCLLRYICNESVSLMLIIIVTVLFPAWITSCLSWFGFIFFIPIFFSLILSAFRNLKYYFEHGRS